MGGEALGLAALAAGSALLEGSAFGTFAVSAAFGSALGSAVGSAFTAAFAGEAFGSALAALGAGAGSGLTATAGACGAGAGYARSGVLDSSLRLDAPELLPSEKNASGEMLSFLAGALTGAGTAVCGGLSAFLRSGVAPAEPSAFRFLPDCSGSDGLLSAGAGAGFEAAGALGLPKNARISMSNRWLARAEMRCVQVRRRRTRRRRSRHWFVERAQSARGYKHTDGSHYEQKQGRDMEHGHGAASGRRKKCTSA